MKVKFLLLTVVLYSLTWDVSAQSLLKIPYGTTPSIDGTFSSQEWSDAASLSMSVLNGSSETTILYKHDSSNLHVAFIGELEPSMRFPEILLDINNTKSNSWENDDWWFHVSATDCEYQREYGNYANCQVTRPNWLGANNYVSGDPVTDTVEIRIPLNTIQFSFSTTDTIGISFLTTNTFSAWEHWPATANRNQPSTWANAVFLAEGVSSIKEETLSQSIDVFPNPNNGSFSVKIDNVNSDFELWLYTLSGKLIANEQIRFSGPVFESDYTFDLPPSVYILHLKTKENYYAEKIVVR